MCHSPPAQVGRLTPPGPFIDYDAIQSDSGNGASFMARKAEGNNTTATITSATRTAAQLKALRTQIDKLDLQIVKLVNERAAIAGEIGRAKLEQGEDIFSPAREEEVYQNVLQANEKQKGPLDEATMRAIFREIM